MHIFNILINSQDQMLAEDNPAELSDIKEMVKDFVTNNGKDPQSSESPEKAVVSLKTDRGTSYEMYISVLDELKQGYNELRADYLNMSLKEYEDLDKENPDDKDKLKDARKAFPYQVSDAEPTDIGG